MKKTTLRLRFIMVIIPCGKRKKIEKRTGLWTQDRLMEKEGERERETDKNAVSFRVCAFK